ncbi:MAG: hypothetical protein ACF8PN_03000 [Phycisphaerales bacterium]
MNVSTFLKHWNINENPFMAEEARQDDVFARLQGSASHPDFQKILGDITRPASAVVFGEKGSGKTALRLQLADAIAGENRRHPEHKALVIAYDELNPVLDRFARRVKGKSALETLQKLRLVDHIDGLLSVTVPDLVDAALGEVSEGHVYFGEGAADTFRKLDKNIREDWVILQSIYDRPDQAPDRTGRLKRRIRFLRTSAITPLKWLSILLWAALAVGAGVYAFMFREETNWPWLIGLIALGVLTLLTSGKYLLDRMARSRIAKQLSNQLRVLDRSAESFNGSLDQLPWKTIAQAGLPLDALDDPRYAMLERLRRAVRPFGFENIIVLVDRVDEPTLVNGETDRMKAVVWPMFNNKFLQQDRFAFKMMLPIELRHELRRQSSDFFQEARLDKQNMIDRLTWPGATLYDLCTARLNSCLEDGADPISLTTIFEDSVTRQDIVDALDQMRQPRDAFKLMYSVIQTHCGNTTEEESRWLIPKLVLDQVRRQQTDRLEALQRGIGPA